jgi:hypothetical protein
MSEREPEQPSAHEPIAAGPQPESAATPAAPTPAPSVLTAEQRTVLDAVLDRLVPANGPVPAAGALGVADAIDRTLGHDAALRRLFFDGLLAIELAATSSGLPRVGAPASFLSLAPGAQDETLRRVEAAEPAFFAALVNHAYRGYYTHLRVLQHLEATMGYPARPPQPLGHTLPPWDPALLDRQRERAPFWRRA